MRAGIRRVVPVDAEPAVAPAHARDVAIGTARARTKSDILNIKMLTGLEEILKLKNEAFQKGDTLDGDPSEVFR